MYTTIGFQAPQISGLPTGMPVSTNPAQLAQSVRSGIIGPVTAPSPARGGFQFPAWLQQIIAGAQARRSQNRQTAINTLSNVGASVPVVFSGVGGLQLPVPPPNVVHSRN